MPWGKLAVLVLALAASLGSLAPHAVREQGAARSKGDPFWEGARPAPPRDWDTRLGFLDSSGLYVSGNSALPRLTEPDRAAQGPEWPGPHGVDPATGRPFRIEPGRHPDGNWIWGAGLDGTDQGGGNDDVGISTLRR